MATHQQPEIEKAAEIMALSRNAALEELKSLKL